MRALLVVAMALHAAACSQLIGIEEPGTGQNDIGVSLAAAGSASGSSLPFDVVVTNDGPDAALFATVTITPPANSQLNASNACQVVPSGPATCPLGRIDPDTASAIRLSVFGGGRIVASVTTTGDINSANNQATLVLGGTADLHVIGSPDGITDTIGAGMLHGYTFLVDNLGPSTARDITLRIDAPGFTPQSATGAGWTCDATTCSLPSLAPFSKATSLKWTALTPTTAGASSVTGTVSSSTPDDLSGNNSTRFVVTVTTAADLVLTLAASPEPVVTGGSLTYTLAMRNLGPAVATSVSVTDTLPAGVTFVSATGTGWTCAAAGQDVSCTRATLDFGDAPPIDLVVTAPASAGTITNTATVSAAGADITPANNTASIATTVQ